MKRRLAMAVVLALLAGWALARAAEPDFLKASLWFDRDALARGEAFRLAVVLDTEEGYHINANPASADSKPTVVEPENHPAITWGEVKYPPGKTYSPTWAAGESLSVYAGRAVVVLAGTVAADAPLGETTVRVTLSYQGCSESACFQPETRTLEAQIEIREAGATTVPANADLFAAAPASAAPAAIRSDERARLESALGRGLPVFLGLCFLGGLLLNLTPCVFPLIPVTMTVFAQQGERRTLRVLLLAILYVAGLATTFTVVGVLAALAGRRFGLLLESPWGVLFIVAVLAMMMASAFGAFEIRLPSGMMGKLGGHRGAPGALLAGLVMGAVAAPCVGPFVGALVAVVAAVGSVLLGAAAFFTVGIGLGIPYVFLGIFTSLINRFPRGGGWLVWTKRLMGLALAGVILYFVERFIRREFFWPLVLGLFLFAGVYLGLLEGLSRRPFTRRFLAVRLATGAALVAAGVYVYAAGSAERPELPWQPWTPDALQAAQAARRPAVLYFGADWCIACREWKAKVFGPIAEAARARPARIPGEKHDILWLYIDVTVLGEGPKKEFARRFDAVNPPAVVLLGRDGKAVAAYRDPPDLETFVKALLEAHTAGRGDKIL